MDNATNVTPKPRTTAPKLVAPPVGRASPLDDTVIVLFAFLGVGAAVVLPLVFNNFSPTTTAFLLATGLAALIYRFLGGIQGTSFNIGAAKLTGTLAALLATAFYAHKWMASDPAPPPPHLQAWEVSGQVTDQSGQPVAPLMDPGDFAIYPQSTETLPGGEFRLKVYSEPDPSGSGKSTFPTLQISYANYIPGVLDLNDPTKVKQQDFSIKILQPIMLKPDPGPSPGPKQQITKISDATAPVHPGSNP